MRKSILILFLILSPWVVWAFDMPNNLSTDVAHTWTASQTFLNLVAAESGASATKFNVYNGITVYATDGNKAMAMDASGNLSILTYLQMYSSNMVERYAYFQASTDGLDLTMDGTGNSFKIDLDTTSGYEFIIDKTGVSAPGISSGTTGVIISGTGSGQTYYFGVKDYGIWINAQDGNKAYVKDATSSRAIP